MRTTERWLSKPGSLDALHLSPEWGVPYGDNAYGLPELGAYKGKLPDGNQFVHFHRDGSKEKWAHFFMDDYRFEFAWNSPDSGYRYVSKFDGCLGPDFSCFVGWPKAANVFNIYRSRWLVSLWRLRGLNVIPTVTWSDRESFEYAFLGLPCNDVLAIGGVAVRKPETHARYIAGVRELMRQCSPTHLYVYGRLPELLSVEIHEETSTIVIQIAQQRFKQG